MLCIEIYFPEALPVLSEPPPSRVSRTPAGQDRQAKRVDQEIEYARDEQCLFELRFEEGHIERKRRCCKQLSQQHDQPGGGRPSSTERSGHIEEPQRHEPCQTLTIYQRFLMICRSWSPTTWIVNVHRVRIVARRLVMADLLSHTLLDDL